MIYDEIHLRIQADGKKYTVFSESAGARTHHLFRLPAELAPLVRHPRVAGSPPGRRGAAREVNLSPSRVLARVVPGPQEIGSLLFKALFAGTVGRHFDNALGGAARVGHGLIVRLHMDPRDARLRALQALPWELLWSEVTGTLGYDRSTPIVRCLDSPCLSRPVALSSPLSVLAVMANPSDTPELDLAGERRRIEEAGRSAGGLQTQFVEHATREKLRQCLRSQSFHFVHFLGHGRSASAKGSGALLLESPAGDSDPLAADELAALFSGRDQPRLVVLNACHTAHPGNDLGSESFTGVAAALIVAGLPAVLAMRAAIGDETAIKVTTELYRCLALGDSLAAAVSEVRLALHTNHPESDDWAIPVLFLRAGEADHAAPSAAAHPPARRATRRRPARGGVVVHNRDKIKNQVNVDADEAHIHVR